MMLKIETAGASIIFFTFFSVNFPRCAAITDREILELSSNTLKDILNPGQYDKRIRPPATNDTDRGTLVTVDTFIRNVDKLSEKDMTWTIGLTLRQRWKDERLKFDDRKGWLKYINLPDASQLWTPDLYFKNEVIGRVHDTPRPNLSVKIFPNGDVLLSTRVTLTLGCPMDLFSYPFDRQKCQIIISSHGHTAEDMKLVWRGGDPIRVKSLTLWPFMLEMFITGYCSTKTITGWYSCLQTTLVFHRIYSYHVLIHYTPCCMMIFVSWLAFWLDPKALLARVGVQLVALLVLLHQVEKIQQSLPPVSYLKAIDVWCGVCLIFVILALVEVVLVNYVGRSCQGGEREEEGAEEKNQPGEEAVVAETNVDDGSPDEFKYSVRTKKKSRSSRFPKFPRGVGRIDVVARLGFPVAFGIFLVFYFSIYT